MTLRALVSGIPVARPKSKILTSPLTDTINKSENASQNVLVYYPVQTKRNDRLLTIKSNIVRFFNIQTEHIPSLAAIIKGEVPEQNTNRFLTQVSVHDSACREKAMHVRCEVMITIILQQQTGVALTFDYGDIPAQSRDHTQPQAYQAKPWPFSSPSYP